MIAAGLAVDARCVLGEGIVWDVSRGHLIWTDIQRSEIWTSDPVSGRSDRWRAPDRVGVVAICTSGALMLGLAKGLYLADRDAASGLPTSVRKLVDVEPAIPTTRLNDGRTDRAGNLVFGTLNEAPDAAPIGSFYQYSSEHGLRRLDLGGAAIPNSICFSPDGARLYFADSLDRTIRCCDYRSATASVGPPRVFVTLSDDQGLPDGSIVDANGYVWNAAWGGGVVRRYSPDGLLERVVHVPTKNPTCPVFGGPDLHMLYVTSSRQEHTEAELASSPDAGGVFAAHIPDVTGLLDAPFALGR